MVKSVAVMNEEKVFDIVQAIICEDLFVDKSDAAFYANIYHDLNADDIDCLNIAFKLEKRFGIRFPEEEVTRRFLTCDKRFVQGGKVTEEGIAEFKRRMPFADLAVLGDKPSLSRFKDVYTVQFIVDYVRYKLYSST